MEYRWAVGEGQRGSYLEGWGGDASISPPLKPGVHGISDLGGLGGDETPVEV